MQNATLAERIAVLGVHPVEANASCYLIELWIDNPAEEFNFGEVTQEEPDEPRENWQVAYAERLVKKSVGVMTYAFFFHYLDLDKPLLTPLGPVKLPQPTQPPAHLRSIQYEAP